MVESKRGKVVIVGAAETALIFHMIDMGLNHSQSMQ